jgi:class 3 adenylate cyclase
VLSKFGVEVWHKVKQVAGCTVKDFGFVRHEYYPDADTVALVVAASQVLGVSVDFVLETFGTFFMEFTRKNGYENLLNSQGSTLRLWLSNMNALHDHLASSLPPGFVKPVFWCEDCDEIKGSILLHYFSKRGSLLAPLVVGVVKEVARFHFKTDVTMTRLALQGEQESEFTTWRIATVDPSESWKLTDGSVGEVYRSYRRATMPQTNVSSSFLQIEGAAACPFSGIELQSQEKTKALTSLSQRDCPYSNDQHDSLADSHLGSSHVLDTSSKYCTQISKDDFPLLETLFPYHIVINDNFIVLHVGGKLAELLTKTESSTIVGRSIGEVLEITRPVLGGWSLPAMLKLTDQSFFIEPTLKNGTMRTNSDIKFKGCLVKLPSGNLLLVLSPDAKNVAELTRMGLTMSDLPLHSFQRDAVFLGEHISSEVRSAHILDKLSKRLENEKNISNTLLYSMLPRYVADELRAGRTVAPTYFENVTLFFSDLVGFTSICDKVEPWDVIDMLNQLYCVMDYLAQKFGIYKVGTIGDAYMCCSGLPTPDEMHSENIANFSIAVLECIKHVCSPVDGKPIKLRIGIHCGKCLAGVVGNLTPMYCLFGDMINTTSRHESTGEPGKIQCSSLLYGRLTHFSKCTTKQFKFTPRGLVPMKGKGECYTYWLDGATEENEILGSNVLKNLYIEVGAMLASRKGRKRRYFRRSSTAITILDDKSSTLPSSKGSMYDLEEIQMDVGTVDHESEDSKSSLEAECLTAPNISDEEKELEEADLFDSDETIVVSPNKVAVQVQPILQECWSQLKWTANLTREELVTHVFELLSYLLVRCFPESNENSQIELESLQKDLMGLVQRISMLYRDGNRFHNWRHACHVVLGVSYLMIKVQEDYNVSSIVLDPWYGFTLAFAALIHDIKHAGVTNMQLEEEGNIVAQIYGDRGSSQERQSLNVGMSILVEEFPQLARKILIGCPLFPKYMNTVIVSTDVFSKDVQARCLEKYAVAVNVSDPDENGMDIEQAEAILEHLMLQADVGHCSQQYETFLHWNRAFFEECLMAFLNNRGSDPRTGWYAAQISFLSNYALPLAARCESLMRGQYGLEDGVKRNLKRWMAEGEAWTDQMIEDLMPDAEGNIPVIRRSSYPGG